MINEALFELLAMRSFLRSTLVFKVTLEDQGAVAAAIWQAKEKAGLLGQIVDDAGDHRLNFSAGVRCLSWTGLEAKRPAIP